MKSCAVLPKPDGYSFLPVGRSPHLCLGPCTADPQTTDKVLVVLIHILGFCKMTLVIGLGKPYLPPTMPVTGPPLSWNEPSHSKKAGQEASCSWQPKIIVAVCVSFLLSQLYILHLELRI